MEPELNRRELEATWERVTDRWPVQRALLAGARVDDLQRRPAQRERGHEYVLVLVSEHFDGVPWLERVYQTGSLWDALGDGRGGRGPLLHAGGVRAQARAAARSSARLPITDSSCCPNKCVTNSDLGVSQPYACRPRR